jgi:hypothetical protein
MKRNLYYRTMLRRDNLLKKAIFSFFQMFASYPRLLLEVFIRKDFGERYFQLNSALSITAILALWPVLKTKILAPFHHLDEAYMMQSEMSDNPLSHHMPDTSLMPHYLVWYLFLALFLVFCFIRRAEIKRNPSVFDFAKFSLYSGTINPLFFKIQLPWRKTNTRLVETIFEPALFFVAGLILWKLLHQGIGLVVVISSIFYSLSYAADYAAGDNFIMDKIDEMIANEELEKSFVEGVESDKTRGFNMRAAAPADIEMRRKVLPLMTDETDIIEAR